METIREETVEHTIRKHDFFCDYCGKFIATTEEYDDGYYYQPNEVNYKMCIHGKWFERTATSCDDCKEKYENKLIKELRKLGFEKKY